jgi:hypothetical protein
MNILNLKSSIKNLVWQDYAFLAVLIVFLFFQITLLSSFNQLPSPLYGGDYYYSMGTVFHTVSGGNPFVSSNVLDSEPIYLPLYTLLVSGFTALFSLTVFVGMKYFAILQMLASLILFYFFGNYFFKNKTYSLAALSLYLPLQSFPVFKYLQFSMTLIFPAFVFSLFYFFEKRNYLSAFICAITFGLMGISHTVGFVASVFLFLILSFYVLFIEKFSKKFIKDKKFISHFLSNFKLLFLIGFIGSIIAMLFWFKPIFVYHGHVLNSHIEFNQTDFSVFSNQITFLVNIFKGYFFNFSSFFVSFKSLLFLVGFSSLFLIKKYDKKIKFLIILGITCLFGITHFFITKPLLDVVFSPSYMTSFLGSLFISLTAVLSFVLIKNFFKKYSKYILITFLVLIFIFNVVSFNNYVSNDRWIQVGKQNFNPHLVSMQDWILENTDVNDVFLSANELNFALNGLTGRKVVNSRRAHNSMFLDVDQRYLDASIMLYGFNDSQREGLFEKYSVDYLYWDSYWLNSEFNFDNQGRLQSLFDPLLMIDTPQRKQKLENNNITFRSLNTWIDPATRGPQVKTFDSLLVLPSRMNLVSPWHPSLDKYLKEVWKFEQNGQVVSRIYAVVY